MPDKNLCDSPIESLIFAERVVKLGEIILCGFCQTASTADVDQLICVVVTM